MIEKDKMPIIIGVLIGAAFIILSRFQNGAFKYLVLVIGNILVITSIFISIKIVNEGNASSITDNYFKVYSLGVIGYFVHVSSDLLSKPYRFILSSSGLVIFELSFVILMFFLLRSYRVYKSALKDALRLSEEAFSARLSGYTDRGVSTSLLFGSLGFRPTFLFASSKLTVCRRAYLHRILNEAIK